MDLLKECIEMGRLEIISDFIETLKDINTILITEDDCNLNLLHFATGVDSVFRDDVINLILTVNDLDINKHSGPGNDYFTAAHIAACYGFTTTLKLLLENGSDPYLLDKENNTVWDIAAFHKNFTCILTIENIIRRKEDTPKKQMDESIYFSLSSINLDDDNEETLKSVDQSSVIFLKVEENRKILPQIEEKLYQRSPGSPKPMRQAITPLKCTPQKKSPPRDVQVTRRKPRKDIPSEITPSKVTPVPKKCPPPQREWKPRILKTKANNNLNETIYTDEDFNVTLIESCNDSKLEPIDPTLKKLTDREIRQQFIQLGESPGPITVENRNAYLRKLKILKSASSGTTPIKQQRPHSPSSPSVSSPFKPLLTYQPSINAILLEQFDFNEAEKLEAEFVEKFFSQPVGPTDFFVYLLLDPRKKNLSQPSNVKIENNPFVRFIKSIFYIGKGKNNRPYMHLYEAAAPAKNNKPVSAKVKRITEIWDQGLGVISLHIVLPMSSNEAYARECLMIDTIGIDKLTNIRAGQKRIDWPQTKRMKLGAYLIHKAFRNHVINGERQIRRADI